MPVGVLAGVEGGARRHAHRVHREGIPAEHAVGREGVDGRRSGQGTAVAAELVGAVAVNHDHQDIPRGCRHRSASR